MPSPCDNLSRLFTPSPVNRHHPLNRGRVAWWMCIPPLMGGRQLFDLMGVLHATATLAAGDGWRGSTRPGGFGQIKNSASSLVTASPSPSFVLSNAITMAAWVSTTTGSNGYIITGSNNNTIYMCIGPGGTTANLASVFINNVGGWLQGTSNCADGQPHRLLVTYNRVSLVVYVDGKAEAAEPHTAAMATDATASIDIGARRNSGGGNGSLVGMIDDVSLWSRAISAAEVQQDYILSRQGYPDVLNRLSSRVISVPSAGVVTTLFRRSLTNRTGSRSAA